MFTSFSPAILGVLALRFPGSYPPPIGMHFGDRRAVDMSRRAILVTIELQEEQVLFGTPARVLIYDERKRLVHEIVATLGRQQGADGGWYQAVTLKSTNPGTRSRS